MSVAAVVLAAGASRRLGELKQLIHLNGETLLERAVRVATEAGCKPVIVVLGASAEIVRQRTALKDVVIVMNEAWTGGMGSSVCAGVHVLDRAVDGCVIMTCDMPAVTAEHLRALMSGDEVMASSYGGRHGVPAYFPREMFASLMQLQGDAGARSLLKEARTIELSGGELDIDTAEDLDRARKLFHDGKKAVLD
ncbi:MAG TPA: nucleotidyltransferase family protein [Edaphobacter sp.]|nr:nucleotidyltransferase family protein [Edaphobacter sp.]